MKPVAKKVLLGAIITLLLVVGLTSYSFLFPKNIGVVDQVRVPLQSSIMQTVSDYIVGDMYYDEEDNLVAGPTDITLEDLDPYFLLLKPSDIVFTSSRGYFGGNFIDGKWKHSVIYIGPKHKVDESFGSQSELLDLLEEYYVTGEEHLIIDASLHGVHIREFKELSDLSKASFLQSLLSFNIERSLEEKEELIIDTIDHMGKSYDYDLLTFNDEEIYCSELIYNSLASTNIILTVNTPVINRRIITPTDMVEQIVFDEDLEEDFSFKFFIEKESYELVERSREELI